jgi:photosystem II stability/assembly factor-like uncharacterized protein
MRKLTIALLALLALTSQELRAQWIHVAGPAGSRINTIVAVESVIVIGTDGGIFRSTNNGDTWTATNIGSMAPVMALARAGGSIFATTLGGGLLRSSDEGITWTDMTPNLPTNVAVRSMAAGRNALFIGTNLGVLRSPDMGTTWEMLTPLGLASIGIWALAVPDTTVVAGTYRGIFFHSQPDSSWSGGTGGISPFTFALKEANGRLFAGTPTGLAVSMDRGMTWQDVAAGPGDSVIFSIEAGGDRIFAGTSMGVIVSGDNGRTWITAGTGLPRSDVRSLAASPTHLYAATADSGLWRIELLGISEVRLLAAGSTMEMMSISQNQPNPLTGRTSITLNLPTARHVVLKVYDILGREVVTLIDGTLSEGRHAVEFDAGPIPNGPYIYQASDGNTVVTRQMLVAR